VLKAPNMLRGGNHFQLGIQSGGPFKKGKKTKITTSQSFYSNRPQKGGKAEHSFDWREKRNPAILSEALSQELQTAKRGGSAL